MPPMRTSAGLRAVLALVAASLVLSACANRRGPDAVKLDTRYVARDVETLYFNARKLVDQGRYKEAALAFDEVERQHPYSTWARRAQLMSGFSYWAARDYPNAILSAQRFLALHPGYKDAPYAYYLIAISQYEQMSDVTRDQQATLRAMGALQDVIRLYPNSAYAADARLKLDLVTDHLAGKEMEIGRYYQKRREWLASVLRFRRVVDEFQTTSHTPEALHRLVESYLALGLPEEAVKTAAILGANHASSQWYDRSFALVSRHGETAMAALRDVPTSPATTPTIRPAVPAAPSAVLSIPPEARPGA
jgi:outer membrane protein assembly factor BamD